jgi:hypothetical protein
VEVRVGWLVGWLLPKQDCESLVVGSRSVYAANENANTIGGESLANAGKFRWGGYVRRYSGYVLYVQRKVLWISKAVSTPG